MGQFDLRDHLVALPWMTIIDSSLIKFFSYLCLLYSENLTDMVRFACHLFLRHCFDLLSYTQSEAKLYPCRHLARS